MMGRKHKVDSHSGSESPFASSISWSCVSTPDGTQELNETTLDHENTSAVVTGSLKKGVSRIVAGALGLREISSIVCKKLESKGSTTYAEIANEIAAEVSERHNNAGASSDKFHENVRRRVYDALNVLEASDIITKEEKAYQWKGLPSRCSMDLGMIKAQHVNLTTRVQRKADHLKELEEQIAGLEHILSRNQKLFENHNAPREGFTLPFMLVQTKPHATVEIEISEDTKLVHFDFNSTPFSLHDDAFVLKLIREHQEAGGQNIPRSSIHSGSSSCIKSVGFKL
ncbi:hypothetical protein SLEP1_g17774 [Rubroshorea leprosula]|uniref:Transcription factor-like protein DPA n=1 Tax=Rubroshorea leprosula TaxID=152421 RepID=A0AAV5J2W7_9ROSI|nr:hypothetical protein SLEP1_g17774 [Rubroshorea leprosula]